MLALSALSDDALPKTIAATINRMTRSAHKQQKQNIKAMFTLRNQYTERSLVYWEARPKKPISRINAIIGTRQPYLALQEEGGRVSPKRGARIPVPTRAARRFRWNRPILRKYSMRRLGRISTPGKRGTSGAFFAKFNKPGIFIRTGKKLLMVRDLSQKSYTLKPRRWHSSAVTKYSSRNLWSKIFIWEASRYLRHYQDK